MNGPVVFLKAHVHGYVAADGRVVRAYERKGPDSYAARMARVYAAAKRAQAGLSPEADHAVSAWQNANWDVGKLEGAFAGREPSLKIEIEHAFAPVRAVLRREFGHTITLHRGQRPIELDQASAPGRVLFSWSADPAEARRFAHGPMFKVLTDEQIAAAVSRYEATGYASVGKESYLRIRDDPGYFQIFDGHRDPVTDGDDLAEHLRLQRADAIAANTARMERGQVITQSVPVEDIAWIPGNLLSKEFIVKRNPLAHP